MENIDEKLARMEKVVEQIKTGLIQYEHNPDEVVAKALHKLTQEQIADCQLMSVVIAVYREAGVNKGVFYHKGRLSGYLDCLVNLEVLDIAEAKALNMWFSEQDRSGI